MTIAELFRRYRDLVVPQGVSQVQLIETERAFYAGAYSFLTSMVASLTDDTSEDDGAQLLTAVQRECEEFFTAQTITDLKQTFDPSATVPDVNYTTADALEMAPVLQDIGDRIKRSLPEGWGFTLFLFNYGEGGSTFYLSSAERADTHRLLREFLDRQTH